MLIIHPMNKAHLNSISKKSRLILILVIIFPLYSYSDELIILGKGIENKKTGDAIAIGCLNENCSELQSFYFNSTERNYSAIGTKITLDISDEATTLEIIEKQKIELKKIAKNYNAYKKRYIGVGEYLIRTFLGLGALGGSLAISSTVVPMISIPLVIGSMIIYTSGLNYNHFKSTMVSKTFLDQNGWNWKLKPDKISDRKFNAYFEYIKNH